MGLLTFLALIYIATLIAFIITLLCLLPQDDKGLLSEKEYYHSLHEALDRQYTNFYQGHKSNKIENNVNQDQDQKQ